MKNLILASLLGFLSVAMGAFGAHALEEVLEPEALKSYETGVRYMMIHAVVILVLNSTALDQKTKNTLSYLYLSGIALFSGSIFLISLGVVSASSIWFVTPLGGLLLLSGWLGLALAFYRKSRAK